MSDNPVVVAVNGLDLFSLTPSTQTESGRPVQLKVDVEHLDLGLSRIELTLKPVSGLCLSRAGVTLRYLPSSPADWAACADSFHWLPNIKTAQRQFAGEHVFRSPAAILTHPRLPGVALIPDLDLLTAGRPAPQFLDLEIRDGEAPCIEWGCALQKPVGHVYYEPTGEPFEVPADGLTLAAWVLHPLAGSLPNAATAFLWSRYGHQLVSDRKPLIMPLSRYAEYGYTPALEHLWRPGPLPGTGGITLSTFKRADGVYSGREHADDLWFHSWFNNARTAWGLAEWGRRLDRPDWVEKSRQVMRLALAAPRDHGVFPAVYAPHDGGWMGSGNQSGGSERYHLPDAAWTALWIRKYHGEIEPLPGASEALAALADFIVSAQSKDGGLPTFVERSNLQPDGRLNGAACGALALWFLGEELLAGGVTEPKRRAYLGTIDRGARHLREAVLPRLRFEDFELYFSCSGKPLDFYDPWTRSYGVNTLAVQWCAEAFRVAHLLGVGTEGDANRRAGQLCMDVLCLFQQVWNPPSLSLYAFGGFGVMNTDGEWHDARQAQLAETLANWYDFTGLAEYRERSIAAARASLALMVCEENAAICPRNYQGTDFQFEVRGMMAENYGHDGRDVRSYQSGFHWGSGSALTTAARLLRRGLLDD
jgi:hypothetical protein